MKRYRVTADHPTFARPDRVVSELELEAYKTELKLAGFENIRVEELTTPHRASFTSNIRWEDLTTAKQSEIEQIFLVKKMGDIDEIDYLGPNGDGVLAQITIESI